MTKTSSTTKTKTKTPKTKTPNAIRSRNLGQQRTRNIRSALLGELRDRLPNMANASFNHVLSAASIMIDALTRKLVEKWAETNGGELNLEEAGVFVAIAKSEDLEKRVAPEDNEEVFVCLDFLTKEHRVLYA
ncbi:hypothetical protein HDU98_004073 [Podochytrium sp. JEL0797]|nr:hypothetical protein HDU98_004073 [Podochytrium sp. JEL0797]